jgi:nucleotide-binding universal stress UspA family protein
VGDTVVVGVDGSSASSGALRWAAEQAARTGAELRVVNVWEIPAGWGKADLVVSDIRRDLEELARETVDEAVAAVRSEERPGLEVRGDVLRGSPAGSLIEASRSAGLLVVGNVGHSPLSGLVLGSVADTVVRHATCPVAVVPSER